MMRISCKDRLKLLQVFKSCFEYQDAFASLNSYSTNSQKHIKRELYKKVTTAYINERRKLKHELPIGSLVKVFCNSWF